MSLAAYARNLADGSIIIVKEGATGYWSTPGMLTAKDADQANELMGITPAIREALVLGSMFGNVPGASLADAEHNFPNARPLSEEA